MESIQPHYAIEKRPNDDDHPFAVVLTTRLHKTAGDILHFCKTVSEAVESLRLIRLHSLVCKAECGLYLREAVAA